MLTFNAITVRLGGRIVLDHVSASLPARSRVGLVGRNGAGKSTLMRVITGHGEADGGAVEMPRGTRLGYIAQETPSGPETPFATVLEADTERARLLAEAEQESWQAEPHRIAEIHERLAAIGAHAAPARAARILSGLGFDEAAQHRTLDSFSGGWRMRVALAALLFSEPDLLLLDEPSNHLDLEATLWLESFLKSYRGMLLVVSHERDLLNNVVDHILHLEAGKVTLYRGGYDAFEHQRREHRAQAQSLRLRQDAKRKKLQAYVDRWRSKSHTARQAQSRMKALARMEPIAETTSDAGMAFHFPSPDQLRPPLITLDGAAVGYVAGTPVLSQVNLRLDPADRVAFLGRNGNGKTTLAHLFAGTLPPMAGQVAKSGKLRVGYFSQHQVEELDGDSTPLKHMTRQLPDAKPGAVRAQLGRFGFSGDRVDIEVRNLSGGERARLALALITREAPHVLILDEPTNHLDVDARQALIEALNEYGGAVVVVSHDRHLLGLTADRLVLVANGTAGEFSGDLDDYRDIVLGRAALPGQAGEEAGEVAAAQSPKPNGPAKPNGPGKANGRLSRKEERRIAAEKRAGNRALRDAVKSSEAEMTRLVARRNEIDQALFDPKKYADSADDAAGGATASQLMATRAEIERELAAAEARWLDANDSLERAGTVPD